MINELSSPDVWLAEQLKKLHMSQNEFARAAGVASSALTNFASGNCGAQTAVDIANYLGIPATITLALIGKVPPPAATLRADAELLAHIYTRLDDERRSALMNYAEFLRAQSPNHQATSKL
jgi:transcriptional regulator with XRE-family HTH domain